MTTKKATRPRKAIPSNNYVRTIEFSTTDRQWASLVSIVPSHLTAKVEQTLRNDMMNACSWLCTERAKSRAGADMATAMRSPGKGQLAPFERLAKNLRLAANAWNDVRSLDAHEGPRIGMTEDSADMVVFDPVEEFGALEALASEAERRLAELKASKTQPIADPWPQFVSRVAASLRKAGTRPSATHRMYSDDAPETWFQTFMWTLQDTVLGKNGYIADSRMAFAGSITNAMRSVSKSGKTRR